jgi:hypothetical protein
MQKGPSGPFCMVYLGCERKVRGSPVGELGGMIHSRRSIDTRWLDRSARRSVSPDHQRARELVLQRLIEPAAQRPQVQEQRRGPEDQE